MTAAEQLYELRARIALRRAETAERIARLREETAERERVTAHWRELADAAEATARRLRAERDAAYAAREAQSREVASLRSMLARDRAREPDPGACAGTYPSRMHALELD